MENSWNQVTLNQRGLTKRQRRFHLASLLRFLLPQCFKVLKLVSIFLKLGHAARFGGFFLPATDFGFPLTAISDSRWAASTRCGPFFFPSIWARLCFRAAIRSVGAAAGRGLSMATTSLPSR